MTLPLRVHAPSAESLTGFGRRLGMPLWLPWPLPVDWLVTGFGSVDSSVDLRATVLACRGPSPVGGLADLLLVAEEPGTGLGGRYAGMASAHPGPEVGIGRPHARVDVQGHQVPLWAITSAAPDRAVYAGESGGRWLWLVVHPESAGVLLLEPLTLADVRDLGHEVDMLAYGEPSAYLALS